MDPVLLLRPLKLAATIVQLLSQHCFYGEDENEMMRRAQCMEVPGIRESWPHHSRRASTPLRQQHTKPLDNDSIIAYTAAATAQLSDQHPPLLLFGLFDLLSTLSSIVSSMCGWRFPFFTTSTYLAPLAALCCSPRTSAPALDDLRMAEHSLPKSMLHQMPDSMLPRFLHFIAFCAFIALPALGD